MKSGTTTQIIAKEGWKYVSITLIFLLLALIFDFLPWVFFAIFAITLFLFRNPERLADEDDVLAILAPSDGTISNIFKTTIEKKEYICVEIQKSLLDVSLLRAPTSLNIEKTIRKHGLLLPSETPLQSALGESALVVAKSKSRELMLRINAGIYSRGIDLFKTVGPLKYAQRMGVLVEGSVHLYVELDSRIKVSIGDQIKAGKSVLGYFAYRQMSA